MPDTVDHWVIVSPGGERFEAPVADVTLMREVTLVADCDHPEREMREVVADDWSFTAMIRAAQPES